MPLFDSARLQMFEWFLSRLRNPTTRERGAHLETGDRGEIAAFFYLRRAGYVVVARDWRSALVRGDLDLVAWEGDTLCVIEVKTRSSHKVATAESSVVDHKRRTLRHLTRRYIRQLELKPVIRFDILSIYFEGETAPQFQLIRGAFGWS